MEPVGRQNGQDGESFGTKSETGSRFAELILTVVTTLRQQRRGVLEFLNAAGRTEVATIVTVIQESRGLSLSPSAG